MNFLSRLRTPVLRIAQRYIAPAKEVPNTPAPENVKKLQEIKEKQQRLLEEINKLEKEKQKIEGIQPKSVSSQGYSSRDYNPN